MLHGALVGLETMRCNRARIAGRLSMRKGLVGCVRNDAECMDAMAHQRRDRRIDHPMPL